MKIVMDSIGFTEVKKLKLAERLIEIGAVASSIGAVIAATGLVLIKGTQSWFVNTTNEQMDLMAKVYKYCEENVTK